tara:strand:- start:86 stop:262 length:177 start_codon:yes stop_codon:yes gene_type:complete
MDKTPQPYFTHASKSMGGKPEKFGLPSNDQIANSVYSNLSKRTGGSSDTLSARNKSKK